MRRVPFVPRLICLSLFAAALTAPPATAAARVVKNAEGQDVSVPTQPERVVVLSEIDLDASLALGLKPVGAVNGRGQSALPHYLSTSSAATLAAGIPIVGDLGRPSVEAIVKLKPDLILTSPLRPETLALLQKVAPTVVTYRNGESWRAVFTRVAAVLGREPAAATFMAGYEQTLQQAKAKLAAVPEKTVSIVRWNANGPAFMYQDAFASLVLRDMGLERPASQRIAGERHSMPLSLESLDVIDAGWLFVGTLDPRGAAVDAMQEMEATPAFRRLSAYKNRRYFPVDGSKWTSIGGPLAALSIVEETTAMMTKSK